MIPCEENGARLLDHLYGLLDEAEAAGVREHLAACVACQAMLAQAERHKSLLARAARVLPQLPAFALPGRELAPAAADTAPLPQETATTLPLSPAAPARARRSALRRYWPAWAAAAAVFVAAFFVNDAYRRGWREHADDIALARTTLREVESSFARLQARSEERRVGKECRL